MKKQNNYLDRQIPHNKQNTHLDQQRNCVNPTEDPWRPHTISRKSHDFPQIPRKFHAKCATRLRRVSGRRVSPFLKDVSSETLILVKSGRRVCDAFATRLRRVSEFTFLGWGRRRVSGSRRRVSGRGPDRSGSLRFFCANSMAISGNRKSNSHKWQDPGKYDGFITAVWLMVQAL